MQDIGVLQGRGLGRGHLRLDAAQVGHALPADADLVVNRFGGAPGRTEQAQRHAQPHAVFLSS